MGYTKISASKITSYTVAVAMNSLDVYKQIEDIGLLPQEDEMEYVKYCAV